MTGASAAGTSDTTRPRERGRRWVRGLRGGLLVAFWLALVFYPDRPEAHAVLVALVSAAAALGLALVLADGGAAPAGGIGDGRGTRGVQALVAGLRRVWPYPAFLVFLTITWLVHLDDASTQEYVRQLGFLVTVFAVADGVRGEVARAVGIVIVGLALLVVQILGPHSVVDALGRPLHYRSIQQWSGYPEIGLLASIGAVACLALALADRRWPVRIAGLVLAAGFTAATMYLLSRFSLITIAIAGLWIAIVTVIGLRGRLGMALVAAGIIAGAGAIVIRADVGMRLRSVFVDRTAAVEIRSEGWRVAWAMLRDHPIVGVGPGRYRDEYPQYSSTGDRTHAYNIVLHEGAELGWIGLGMYLAMWARVLWRSVRAAGRTAAGVAALAMHGMLVAFFLRSQSEHFLANLDASFRVLLLLAVLFGLAEGLGRRSPARAAP